MNALLGGAACAALCVLATAAAAQANPAAFELQYKFSVTNGDWPTSGPVAGADGLLYGIATANGRDRYGTLYRRGPSGRVVTMHWFDSADGNPDGHLTPAPDGSLWGITNGGANVHGSVYRFDPSTKTVRIVHAFDRVTDGSWPEGRLLLASDGFFYGTTRQGGGTGYAGTIYRLDPATGDLSSLYAFARAAKNIGVAPSAGLVEAPDGYLYGTTYTSYGYGSPGSAFRFDRATAQVALVHHFDYDTEGGSSSSTMVAAANGTLYGTLLSGGPKGGGSIYALSPAGALTVLHAFTTADGAPNGGLTLAGDGYLYGVTVGGGLGHAGTVYRIAPDGTGFGVVTNFGYGDAMAGNNPMGEVNEFQGALWGVTNEPSRGASDGVLYSLTPRTGR
jgi:uncharacterized repeat protein (TIGR03803 family)